MESRQELRDGLEQLVDRLDKLVTKEPLEVRLGSCLSIAIVAAQDLGFDLAELTAMVTKVWNRTKAEAKE